MRRSLPPDPVTSQQIRRTRPSSPSRPSDLVGGVKVDSRKTCSLRGLTAGSLALNYDELRALPWDLIASRGGIGRRCLDAKTSPRRRPRPVLQGTLLGRRRVGRHRGARPRAAATTRRRVDSGSAPPTSGPVTFGSNCVRRSAKKAFAETSAPLRPRATGLTSRSTRSTTTRSRRTSTATCRASRTTRSPGSPATACGSSPHQGLATRHQRRLGHDRRQLQRRASRSASTGDDGKQYFVPFYYYPWALFYRKSLFEEKGYQVPQDASTS